MSERKPTAEERIASLERELQETRERLEAADPRPKRPEVPSVDLILDKALEKTNNDPQRAADLFHIWAQQSSEVRDSLRPLIEEAIQRRLAERVAAQ